MFSKYKFNVQNQKKLRVIIDSDAACEADDQYALVHALLTPRFEIKGIVAEQFTQFGSKQSVHESFEEINKVMRLMNISDIPVILGADMPLSEEHEILTSPGADFIIEEALKEDDQPLYVLCQGALTNVAIALNKAPEISDKFICIWIGGGEYPDGGWEFNLFNDFHATNKVFNSTVELWQVPMDCYTQVQVSYAELQTKVRPYGQIGKYLFDEMQALGMKADWISGEAWGLGDSPALALALNPGCGRYRLSKAPIINHKGEYVNYHDHNIRVYYSIDSRYILEDFFAKLKIMYGD